ncbi:MAG: DNA cytosine methyltransferase [Thermodesulfobacteriota bacterium]
MKKIGKTKKIVVFDFFCGCGGTSRGFQKAGIDVAFALDTDPDAKNTFTKNFPDAFFCDKSIISLESSDLESVLLRHKNSYKLFCGCAPCQPFTRQFTERAENDTRKNLLSHFGVHVEKYRPDFVFVENVPGLQKVPRHKDGPFSAFVELLKEIGYQIAYGIVAAQDYGAPQLRRRFVLLASKHGDITIPSPTHGNNQVNPYQTVRHAIEDLPVIAAGETYNDPNIPNHRASHLSELNMRRIKASPHNGGGRNDWPKDLWPQCYTRPNKNGALHPGHTDCYGRLWWDKPATGLTTRCISYSNGRFGHPEQDRAISIREAARLQGFDDAFEFTGSMNSMARQIGNAVPVDLAYAMGKHFVDHIEAINGQISD